MEDKKNYLVGITGITGSGKTTVSNILRDYGYTVLDIDDFSRKIIREEKIIAYKLKKIIKKEILYKGNIDYKKVGNIFDKYPHLENQFEEWFQIFLGNKIKEEILLLKNDKIIYFFDIPFLYKKGIHNLFDYIWVIESKKDYCFQRIKLRNNYSDEKIINLIENSNLGKNINEKNITIIKNNSTIYELKSQIKNGIENLLKNIKLKGEKCFVKEIKTKRKE